jgi:DMSO reductase anchor subunit
MKPAPSIIFFTVASGAGYGLLFWLGVLKPLGLLPASSLFGATAAIIALALITAGLCSSLLHLGRPERAWRALSQWRSSWLSREGVAAVITFLPATVFLIALAHDEKRLILIAGLLSALGAVVTVYCTGMIYASLKPIKEWHHPMVAPGYLLFASFSGASLLAMLAICWGGGFFPALVAAALGLAALMFKRAYWASVDATPELPAAGDGVSRGSGACAEAARHRAIARLCATGAAILPCHYHRRQFGNGLGSVGRSQRLRRSFGGTLADFR